MSTIEEMKAKLEAMGEPGVVKGLEELKEREAEKAKHAALGQPSPYGDATKVGSNAVYGKMLPPPIPRPETDAEVALKARIQELEQLNGALLRSVSLMHRRTQANEGAAARAEKAKAGAEREIRGAYANANYWRDRATREAASARHLAVTLDKVLKKSLWERIKAVFS